VNCNLCGAASTIFHREDRPSRTIMQRRCSNGHVFTTHEVHTTMLADAREMTCAVRNIERRIARFKRDSRIAADRRSATVVAGEYGLTEARVRQIRAAFPALHKEHHGMLWPTAQLNLEREEA
jgi:hypothetical protein